MDEMRSDGPGMAIILETSLFVDAVEAFICEVVERCLPLPKGYPSDPGTHEAAQKIIADREKFVRDLLMPGKGVLYSTGPSLY